MILRANVCHFIGEEIPVSYGYSYTLVGVKPKSTNILITLGTISAAITLQPMCFRESRGLAARRAEPLHQRRSKVKGNASRSSSHSKGA